MVSTKNIGILAFIALVLTACTAIKKETPVQETSDNVEDIEQDSDEQLDVETITWYKKEYYMLDEGGEKKVFEIEDDDLGKEVGLWIDNKLVRPGKK